MAARHGIPIDNLTSQIFANIYLNELDRFVVHTLRPQAYLRYGDDFIVIDRTREDVGRHRQQVRRFLDKELRLVLHPTNDIVVASKRGLRFLGVHIFPGGRRLLKRTHRRITERLAANNRASYHGLVLHHEPAELRRFDWQVLEQLEQEDL